MKEACGWITKALGVHDLTDSAVSKWVSFLCENATYTTGQNISKVCHSVLTELVSTPLIINHVSLLQESSVLRAAREKSRHLDGCPETYLVLRFESSDVHPAMTSSSWSRAEQLVQREHVVSTRLSAMGRVVEVRVALYSVSRTTQSGTGSSEAGTAVLLLRLLRLLSPNNSFRLPQPSKSSVAFRSVPASESSAVISWDLEKNKIK